MTIRIMPPPTGRTIPSDVAGLLTTHGDFLAELLQGAGLKGKTVQTLLDEMSARGVLPFDVAEYLPNRLTSVQACELLGSSWSQWTHWHYNSRQNAARHSQYLPKPLKGEVHTKTTEYATKDILGVLRSPKKFGSAPVTYPIQTAQIFDEYIRASAERILYDWKKLFKQSTEKTTPVRAKKPEAVVSFVAWPIGVPKDYTVLYREYRVFVEKILNRYIKPCPSQQIEDVKQHIWMKLIESNTLGKFVEKARYRKIPAKATAAEAVEYLGITWDQWMDLTRKDLKWLQPVEGTAFSTTAIFTKAQIRNVEESGLFPIIDAIPANDMSKVFRGYLKNVVHNHFANYCRTRVRRFIKDTVVPGENSRVNGGKLGTALDGDATSWEDALEDMEGFLPDEGLDLPDCNSVETLTEDLTAQIHRIHKAVPPARQDEVFNLIAEGCTLREAISRVRVQVHSEKLQVRVG